MRATLHDIVVRKHPIHGRTKNEINRMKKGMTSNTNRIRLCLLSVVLVLSNLGAAFHCSAENCCIETAARPACQSPCCQGASDSSTNATEKTSDICTCTLSCPDALPNQHTKRQAVLVTDRSFEFTESIPSVSLPCVDALTSRLSDTEHRHACFNASILVQICCFLC